MKGWVMPEEERTTEETAEKTKETTEEAQPYKSYATKAEHEAAIEATLKDRLERKDKKLAEEKAETERVAREQALKDQEDWKRLAEERTNTITEKEKRIAELQATEIAVEAANDRVQTLEERLKGLITPQLEAVPELYRPFVSNMPVEQQAEWLEANADKLGTQQGAGRPAGSRPTGRPETPPRKEQDKEARENQRRARVSAI